MVCVVNRNSQQGYRDIYTVAHSDALTLLRVKVASQNSGGIGLYSCGHDVRSDDAPFLGADS